jgi:hypothetical protein
VPAAGFNPVGQTIKCLLISSILSPALFFDDGYGYLRSRDMDGENDSGKMMENLGNTEKLHQNDVVSMASGFPVGIGKAVCTCGAVVGGVMSLGLVFGRNTPKDSKMDKAMKLYRELHDSVLIRIFLS